MRFSLPRSNGKCAPRKQRPACFRPRLDLLEDRTLPSTVTWINAAGGDWDTPANWDANRVPNLADDAVINLTGITVTHATSANDSARRLQSAAALSISSGTLSLATASTIDSMLTLSGGTLAGAGDLSVTGLLTWMGGTQTGPGHTEALGGLVLNGGATDLTLDNRTLDNAAVATWMGSRNIALNNGAVFNNLAGATFDGQNNNTVTTSGLTGSFTNGGTLQKSAGTGTTTFNVPVRNDGTVDVQVGTLRLNDGGASGGQFMVEAPATLNFSGGNSTLAAGSAISGTGKVLFSGDIFGSNTTTVAGSYDVGNETTISGGTASFLSNVTFPSLTLSGGTLSGVGDVTVAGLLTWTGGTMSGPGTTFADGGVAFNGTSFNDNPTLNGRKLVNAGVATWSNTQNLGAANGAVIDNLPGATFVINSDRTFSSSGSTTVFLNEGVFRKQASSDVTTINIQINNTGTVDVQTGTLKLGGGGLSEGTFTVAAGATLNLSGAATTLTATSAVVGDGNVLFSSDFFGGTTTVAGLYAVTGATTITGGTVNFPQDITFPALTMSGGSLAGFGNVTVAGLLTWNGGTMTGPGTTFANGGITMNLTGFSTPTLDGRTLANAGNAIWSGLNNLSASNGAVFNNLEGATFTITSNTVFASNFGGDTPRFNNAGTVIKTGSSGTTRFNVAFVNTGTLDVETGTLELAGAFPNYAGGTLTGGTYVVAATLQIDNAAITSNAANIVLDGPNSALINLSGFATNTSIGSFTIQNGRNFTTAGAFTNAGTLTAGFNSRFMTTGVYTQLGGLTDLEGGILNATGGVSIQGGALSGSGVVEANVTNAGLVTPGGDGTTGILSITGSYTQTAAGVLNIDIGGLVAGTGYDQLQITGAATLDGTLNVQLVGGFTPQPGGQLPYPHVRVRERRLRHGERAGPGRRFVFRPGLRRHRADTRHAAHVNEEASGGRQPPV